MQVNLETTNDRHWRIQEFTLGGPNQDPQSKVEGEARIEGAKRPRIEGEARVEGAKRPRIEGEARTEGEAWEKTGEGSGEGARWAPPQKIFEKSILKPCILVHIWGKHLKYSMSGKCFISLKKIVGGLGDEVPQKLKPFGR